MDSSPPSPGLSACVQSMRAGVFADLQQRIDAFGARGGQLIPFHIGDTAVDPPAGADFARAIAPRGLFAEPADNPAMEPALYRYGATSGLPALRRAIATWLQGRHGWAESGAGGTIDSDREVLVGAGATHAIFSAARAALDPGDDVLLLSPYWPLAHGILRAVGAHPIEVPWSGALYADARYDTTVALRDALTPHTKAIYLITPNNPDGKVASRAQLAAIAEVAIDRNLWVFSDEAYADFTFDAPHVTIASLPGMRERTIAAYSLSKSYALAGARVGCVVAPAPLVEAARKVSTHTVFNVPVISQRSALAAIETGDAWADAARARYRRARDLAAAPLARAGIPFHMPEGAAYLFLDFSELLGARPLRVLLERAIDHGVLLAPGEAFGRGYEQWARLCFTSVGEATLLDGVDRLLAAVRAM